MGEAAEALINGDDCQECGEYIGEGDGFSRLCSGCKRGNSDDVGGYHPKFDEEIEKLKNDGYLVDTFTPYHYCITKEYSKKRIDLFPKKGRYHDVTNNIRGPFINDQLYYRITNFFRDSKPQS